MLHPRKQLMATERLAQAQLMGELVSILALELQQVSVDEWEKVVG